MNRAQRTAGFTLIELLIAAAISSIVLILAVQGLVGSTQTVMQVGSQSDIIEENRVAGQMIADSITRAAYVYPPGTTLSFAASSSALYKDPVDGNNTFTVGSSPIVAYLAAPEDTAVTCGTIAPAGPSGCLTFVAYYAVRRGDAQALLNGTPEDPGADTPNANDWLIYEYRKTLKVPALTTALNPPLDSSNLTIGALTGSTPALVADYIAKDGFALSRMSCRNNDSALVDASGNNIPLDSNGNLAPGVAPGCPATAFGGYLASMRQGTLTLQTALTRAGKTYSNSLGFAVAPRNLYVK